MCVSITHTCRVIVILEKLEGRGSHIGGHFVNQLNVAVKSFQNVFNWIFHALKHGCRAHCCVSITHTDRVMVILAHSGGLGNPFGRHLGFMHMLQAKFCTPSKKFNLMSIETHMNHQRKSVLLFHPEATFQLTTIGYFMTDL